MFYKSDYHREQTEKLLGKLGKSSIESDKEYGILAYIIGATYKADQLGKAIDSNGNIDVDKAYEIMGVFSSAEKDMIRFAFQLFNSSIDNITLSDVFHSLDADNTRIIKQAIDFMY